MANNQIVWHYLKERRKYPYLPFQQVTLGQINKDYIIVHMIHTSLYKPDLLMSWVKEFNNPIASHAYTATMRHNDN